MLQYDDRAESLVRILVGSGARIKIIANLAEGPKHASELATSMRMTTANTLHSIKPLVEDGTIVKRSDGRHHLTKVGHIRLQILSETINSLVALDENKHFWQSHDLGGIPGDLQARVGQLVGGVCVHGGQEGPLDCQDSFVQTVSKARCVWGVSPYSAPGYPEMITGLLERGAEVSLILTKGVIGKINPLTLRACLAKENFRLSEVPDGVTVAFTVADETLLLGLSNTDGSYDPLQDLVCSGEDAARWGKDLYNFYLKQSRPIHL